MIDIKLKPINKISFYIFLFYSFLLSAPIIQPGDTIYPSYPQSVIIPSSPTQNDSVMLWLILGEYGNSCIPTYNTSFKIQQISKNVCVRAPCPQDYEIYIFYKENPIPPILRPCLMVITQYGPKFSFGKLSVGTYTVIDSTKNGNIVARFTVSETSSKSKIEGTVIEDAGLLDIFKPIQKAKIYLSSSVIIYYPANKDASIISPIIDPVIIDSTFTNSNGQFLFENVSQGAYRLQIIAEGYQTQNIYVNVPPDTTLKIAMLKENVICSVLGNVKELICSNTNPQICKESFVEGCSVYVFIPFAIEPLLLKSSAPIITGIKYSGITDKSGNYKIDSIPLSYENKTVTITATKSGYAQENNKITLLPNSAVTANFILTRAYTNAETTSVSDVIFTVATEKPQYLRGESIKTRYCIFNNSIATVTFDFSSGCQFDMTAIAHKDTIYSYTKNIACTEMLTKITLAPGEQKIMDFPAFTYNDTSGQILITAKLIGYDKSSASIIVPVLPATKTKYALKPRINYKNKSIISYSNLTKTIILNIPSSQNVSVSAYILNGRKVSQLSTKKFLPAGVHYLSLKNFPLSKGVIIFKVEGEQFSESKRINIGDN